MALKGILFDFDGVVVDSMHQHYDAWSKAFAEKNIFFEKEELFMLEGQGLSKIARMLAEPHGLIEQDVLDVIEEKARYYYKSVQIRFYDHFMQMLKFLRKEDVPMVVVTGGNRLRVEKTIHEYFDGFFTDLVTIDDVQNGKPHPEPFLKGAEKLGLKPQECIVIENAPLGIKAARAAQCTVIAIQTTLPEKYLSEADYIFETFNQVEEKLIGLLNLKA